MTETEQQSTEHPLRNPYVWMLLCVLGWSVMSGLAMILVAIKTNDGVVVDDYYRQGRLINRRTSLDQQAADYGLRAQLTIDQQLASLHLHRGRLASYPDQLQITLWHSTLSGYDHIQQLTHLGEGHYSYNLKTSLRPGQWNLELTTTDWRLVGDIRMPIQSQVELTPSAMVSTQ